MIDSDSQHQPQAAAPEGAAETDQRYTTGIYRLPVAGKYLRDTREFADSLRPTDEDSWGVRSGKNLARGGIVVGTTGVIMIAVL